MTLSRPWLLIAGFLAMATFAGARRPQTTQSGPDDKVPAPRFSLFLTADQPSVPVGSKIVVRVTFKNISDGLVFIEPTGPDAFGSEFHFDILDDKGNRVKLRNSSDGEHPVPGFKGGNGSTLGQGESFDWRIELNKIYLLDRAGKYSIQARYDWRTKAWIKSNMITINVNP